MPIIMLVSSFTKLQCGMVILPISLCAYKYDMYVDCSLSCASVDFWLVVIIAISFLKSQVIICHF